MSLRPISRASPATSGNSDHGRPIHPAINTPQQSPRPMNTLPPLGPRNEGTSGPAAALTPLSQASDTSPPTAERKINRSLGMSSILNPLHTSGFPQSRRRSAAQMESPSPVEPISVPSLPPLSRRPSLQNLTDEDQTLPAPPRRILSPRSPSFHGRYQPINYGPPTGSIEAQSAPFLTQTGPGAQRAISINTNIAPSPSMPTPPPHFVRHTYLGDRGAPTPPPAHATDSRRLSLATISSRNPSPISVESSRYGPSQLPLTLPPTRHATPQSVGPSSVPPPSHRESGPSSSLPLTRLNSSHSYGIPIVPSGSGSLQMMAIQTNSGEVHIPVDIQAGSRASDEKRKRNAGASARFRARRKEKEREASTTIDQLRQQLRDAEEDMAFYRHERDAMRDVLAQFPDGHRHFPRPASPRHTRPRRPVHSENSSPQPSSDGHMDNQGPYEPRQDQPAEDERNVRRRTSSYVPIESTEQPEHSGPQPPLPGPVGYQKLPMLQPPHGHHQEPQHQYRQLSPRRVVSHDPFLGRSGNQWPQAPPESDKQQ